MQDRESGVVCDEGDEKATEWPAHYKAGPNANRVEVALFWAKHPETASNPEKSAFFGRVHRLRPVPARLVTYPIATILSSLADDDPDDSEARRAQKVDPRPHREKAEELHHRQAQGQRRPRRPARQEVQARALLGRQKVLPGRLTETQERTSAEVEKRGVKREAGALRRGEEEAGRAQEGGAGRVGRALWENQVHFLAEVHKRRGVLLLPPAAFDGEKIYLFSYTSCARSFLAARMVEEPAQSFIHW